MVLDLSLICVQLLFFPCVIERYRFSLVFLGSWIGFPASDPAQEIPGKESLQLG